MTTPQDLRNQYRSLTGLDPLTKNDPGYFLFLEKKHLELLSSTPKLETIPYQCCPKCNGEGYLKGVTKISLGNISTTPGFTCDVCKGEKIIPMHIVRVEVKEVNKVELKNLPSLTLRKSEEEVIKQTLTKNKGRRKKTADELGISERTLYRRIVEYGIDWRKKIR